MRRAGEPGLPFHDPGEADRMPVRPPCMKPLSFFLANLRKPLLTHAMIRVIAAVCASFSALLAASCCCTSEPKAPPLRPLPQFQEVPAAPEVHYTK